MPCHNASCCQNWRKSTDGRPDYILLNITAQENTLKSMKLTLESSYVLEWRNISCVFLMKTWCLIWQGHDKPWFSLYLSMCLWNESLSASWNISKTKINIISTYLQQESWYGNSLWEMRCSKEQSWPRAVCFLLAVGHNGACHVNCAHYTIYALILNRYY